MKKDEYLDGSAIRIGSWWAQPVLATGVWFALSLFAVCQSIWSHQLNNFEVFRHVTFHLQQHRNLYLTYPAEYGDVNLYGPVFGILIAPFALMPVALGAVCWVMANTAFLYVAIVRFPMHPVFRGALLLLCAHEMMNNSSWLQTNGFVCGCLLLGFSLTLKGKERWALLFILLASFVKLYGIVGLLFFCFSAHKRAFVGWAIWWSLVCLVAPMLLTSFSFLLTSYQDWFRALQVKAAKNIRLDNHNFYQDISIPGMIRRVFYANLQDRYIVIPGGLLFISQWVYYRRWQIPSYQLYLLCSSLLTIVLYSSGAESPTYIIALPAICLWFFLQPRQRGTVSGFIAAWAITTFSYSDLLTPWFRNHIAMPYSLKALPSAVIWCILFVQIHKKQYQRANQLE